MSLMNYTPPSILLKGPSPVPVRLLTEAGQRTDTHTYTAGLKDLCHSLNVSFLKEVGPTMGRVGTLKRDGDGWMMRPKPIPKTTLSAWINGREKIPLWRLAQAVSILELMYLNRKDLAVKYNSPEDDLIWLHLKIAAQWFVRFGDDKELFPWLNLLRCALYGVLKRDKDRSAADAKFYQLYTQWLDTCGVLAEAEGAQAQAS